MARKRWPNYRKSWSAFGASWPFLWQHLTNTAHCLAAAVWNEDEAASALFRQSLARWRSSLSYRLDDSADLRWRRLLFPSILDLEWPEASARVLQLGYDYMPAPTPSQVFSTILDGVHDDAVLLTAGLLLFWSIEKKQTTDIGGRNASALLRGEDEDEDGHRPRRQLRFRSLFFDIFRLELAGERFRDESYAALLDGLVQRLDNMTERRVVPGRIFTPSTLRDRDDLLHPFVAMLAAAAPSDGDGGFPERTAEFAREEEVLPEGDRSLRNLVHQLGRFETVLKPPLPQLTRGLALLAPGRDAEVIASQLHQIVDAAKTAIENQRLERLKARSVNADKLEDIRAAIETALLSEPAEAPFFLDVQVGRTFSLEDPEIHEIPFNGVPKARFIEPPMEAPSAHFREMFVSGSREAAGRFAWHTFCRRARVSHSFKSRPEQEAFWGKIAPLIAQVGAKPVLVLSQTEGQAMRRVMRAAPADRAELRIERRPRTEIGGSYIGTIEGVDVLSAGFLPGTAWLFSDRTRYAAFAMRRSKVLHAMWLSFSTPANK